jgi:biopolymer transport protein TolR
MAFKMGGSAGGLQNEPNVVPMIDILLVLLIIFMIMQPLARKSVDLQLPDPTPQDKPPDAKPDQIILEILPNGTFAVNKEPMTRENLARRLKEIYDPRPEKIMFVKGDPEAVYQDVIWAMDMARGSGVKVLGITPIDVK